MKALKSKLASRLLADPVASAEFRQFLVNKSASAATAAVTGQFTVRGEKGQVRVQATVVPKAAKVA